MRAKLIHPLYEMSIQEVEFHNIITNKIIQDVLDQYHDDDLYDEEELKTLLINQMEDDLYDIIYRFENELIDSNNEIKIYRKITIDDTWFNHIEKQGKRLGIYWSWDMRAAETHWGYDAKKQTITIESSINSNHVDWIETLQLNIHPSYKEEKEVRLFKNTPIKILNIYDDNDNIINISNTIRSKIYKA